MLRRFLSAARRVRTRPPAPVGAPVPSSEPGWRTVDIAPPEVVGALRELAALHLPERIDSYYSTNVHASREVATTVDRELKQLLGPRLRDCLPNHEIFLGVLIAKEAGSEGSVGFHQDWTFTDERQHRSVNCWIPLVDTDHHAGAMRMVEGSHLWTGAVRPSGADLPTDPFPPDLQEALGRVAATVPLRAGQGVVYDPALVHGSWPNRAPIRRVAAALALAPVGARLVHFHVDAVGALRGHPIDGSHFTTAPYGSAPTSTSFEPWAPLVDLDDIRRGAARLAAR